MKTPKQLRKLLIFDGNNVFRRNDGVRAFQFMAHKGVRTGALYGTIREILTDTQSVRPDEVVVVFDGKGSTAEKQKIYAGYKAHRHIRSAATEVDGSGTSMSDALYGQMLRTIEILRTAGICVVHKAGKDADDVIGCLATQTPNRSVLIHSADKDFLQLLTERIAQIRTIGSEKQFWYAPHVQERFGVRADQFADYLALVGDGIDGIPGLRGCGPVEATKLLTMWGDLDRILANTKFLKDGQRERVQAQRKQLKTFQSLTRIDTEVVPVEVLRKITPLFTPQPYDETRLQRLLLDAGCVKHAQWFRDHRPTVLSRARGLFGG